jgi:hypothetical protein
MFQILPVHIDAMGLAMSIKDQRLFTHNVNYVCITEYK